MWSTPPHWSLCCSSNPATSRIEVIGFDVDLAARAVDGWRRFGKGRHPAQLNFGDCCTYALAERTGDPILCVGDDFARTDLPVRRPPA